MKRGRLFVFGWWALLQVSCVLLYNISSLLYSCQAAMVPLGEQPWVPLALKRLRCLDKLPFLPTYAAYAGVRTGYGFFAPQVASPFLLMVDLYDPEGRVLWHNGNPGLRTASGILRYNAFLGRLQALLPPAHADGASRRQQRLAKAMVHSLTMRLAARFGAARARCRVSLLDGDAFAGATGQPVFRRQTVYEWAFIPNRL